MTRPYVAIREGVAADLVPWCRDAGYGRLLVVADPRTQSVLGAMVEDSLRRAGLAARSVILDFPEVQADAHSILHVMLSLERSDQALVAVGAGTITDITRFVSHRVGLPFISVPTAPSVDGFPSPGSPLIVRGIKTTAPARPPAAIFADLAVLCRAPRAMIAAGFGDMLGKITSVADWKLGSLLWDLPFDGTIADRCLAAVRGCMDAADEIAAAGPRGVQRLLEALLESGFCMLDFGSSLPASGAEHHVSHFWEMKLLREGKPAILHGAKVGAATVLTAGLYERLRRLPRAEAARRLETSRRPSPESEMQVIRQAYGPAAEEVARTQAPFLAMTDQGWERLKQKIIDCWETVMEIAREVPGPQEVARLLKRVGGPSTVGELGLPESWQEHAVSSAHYLRNHFTVLRLARVLWDTESGIISPEEARR
jgi:glycerol-1-phosphate dehydrogenase [NAD(P)+]